MVMSNINKRDEKYILFFSHASSLNYNNLLKTKKNINIKLGIGDWTKSPIPNPQSPIPKIKYFKKVKIN
jgi:hypothetical protein